MNHPAWHWALAAAALVAGYRSYGWPGVVLAFTAIVFWLLLQFNRAVRVMQKAGRAPKGQVPSAVMLHAQLRTGMTMLQVLPLAGSLGEALDAADDGRFAWRDAGGRRLIATFAGGRLTAWELGPADLPGEVASGEASAASSVGSSGEPRAEPAAHARPGD